MFRMIFCTQSRKVKILTIPNILAQENLYEPSSLKEKQPSPLPQVALALAIKGTGARAAYEVPLPSVASRRLSQGSPPYLFSGRELSIIRILFLGKLYKPGFT